MATFKPPPPPRKRPRSDDGHLLTLSSTSVSRSPSQLFTLPPHPPSSTSSSPTPLLRRLSPGLSPFLTPPHEVVPTTSIPAQGRGSHASPRDLYQDVVSAWSSLPADSPLLSPDWWVDRCVCIPELVYPETAQLQLKSALQKLRVRACHQLDGADDVGALIVDERQLQSECMERLRVERAAAAATSSPPPFPLVRPYSLSTALHSLEQAKRRTIPFFSVTSLIAAAPSILRPRPPPLPHPTLRLTSASSSHLPFERTFPPPLSRLPSGLPSHPLLWLTAPRGSCPFLPPLKGRRERVKEVEGEEDGGEVEGEARRLVDVEKERERDRLGSYTCEMCGQQFKGPLVAHLDSAKHRQQLQQQNWAPLLQLSCTLQEKRRQFDEQWVEQQGQGQRSPSPLSSLSPASLSPSGVVVVYSRHPPPAEFELTLYGDQVIWSSPPHLHNRVARIDDDVWRLGVSFVHEQYKEGRHRQMVYPPTPALEEDEEMSRSRDLDAFDVSGASMEEVSASSFPSSEGLLATPSPSSPLLSPQPMPLIPLTPLVLRHPNVTSPPIAVRGETGGAAAPCASPEQGVPSLPPPSPTQPYHLRSSKSRTPRTPPTSSPVQSAKRSFAKRQRGSGSRSGVGGGSARRQLVDGRGGPQRFPSPQPPSAAASDTSPSDSSSTLTPTLQLPPMAGDVTCGGSPSLFPPPPSPVSDHSPMVGENQKKDGGGGQKKQVGEVQGVSLDPSCQLQRQAEPLSPPRQEAVNDKGEAAHSESAMVPSSTPPSSDAADRLHSVDGRRRRVRQSQPARRPRQSRELSGLEELTAFMTFQDAKGRERERDRDQRQRSGGSVAQPTPLSLTVSPSFSTTQRWHRAEASTARRNPSSASPPLPPTTLLPRRSRRISAPLPLSPSSPPSSSFISPHSHPFDPLPRLTRSQREELGFSAVSLLQHRAA